MSTLSELLARVRIQQQQTQQETRGAAFTSDRCHGGSSSSSSSSDHSMEMSEDFMDPIPPSPPPSPPHRGRKRTHHDLMMEGLPPTSALATSRYMSSVAPMTGGPVRNYQVSIPATSVSFVPLQQAVRASITIDRGATSQPLVSDDPARVCFLCEYGNLRFDGSDMGCRPYVRLLNLIKEAYGHCSNEALGHMAYRFYRTHLYEPIDRLLDEGEVHPLPPMSPALFEEHIVRHTLNPYIMVGENVKLLRDAIIVLRNKMVDEITNDVDPRKIDALTKLMNAQKTLLTMPTTHLLFGGNETIAIDPTSIGTVGNLRRVQPLLQKNGASAVTSSALPATAAAAPPPVAPDASPDDVPML